MRILITGSRGFVGTETRKLLGKHEVIHYDLLDCRDIRDLAQLEGVIRETKPERVLHLAAIARFADADSDPRLTHETNAVGTENVTEACRRFHLPLVYSSTGSVYMPVQLPPPITEKFPAVGNSQYGCSKYIGELFVKTHTPHIILRYAHIYGKEKRGHGLIGGYLERIERGLKPMLYGGEQSNDFVYVKDIAQANVLALESPWDKWNQAYNIGTGEEITAEQAGEIICRLTGWTEGVEKKTARTVDPSRFVYDITKARVMLKYEPQFTFAQGLADMFENGV